jgi:6-phosphofructokinase 2
VLSGPELTEKQWRHCLEVLENIEPFPKYVVASGRLPPGVPIDFYGRIARLSKKRQARFVLDTSGEPLKTALEEGVYLIKPNLRELSELVGRSLHGETDWAEACRQVLASRQLEAIALTLGHRGGMLAVGNQLWTAPSLNIKPISAVGAGDSFLGGLLWSLASGHDFCRAFTYGMAAGSAAVLAHGTGLADPKEVARLYQQVRVRTDYHHDKSATTANGQ